VGTIERTPATTRTTLAAVLGLWSASTVLQTLVVVQSVPERTAAPIELGLAVLAVWLVLRSGLSPSDCFLVRRGLSWQGAAALGWLVVLWPFILATGEWIGWDAGLAVTQGAGGVAQELLFRAALLPVLLRAFGGRPWPALLAQTALFAVWHGGAFLAVSPDLMAGATMIVGLSVLAGLAWGWQTLHDRTVLWAILHHTLLWVVGSMFDLGPPE